MEKAMQHIMKGFDILCAIPVSGENVERMAAAKYELRAGYAALEAAKSAADEQKKKTEVNRNG